MSNRTPVRDGGAETDAAYQRCEEITRAEAKNFSYGIRLLPPAKRRALSAVYALARRIDDIGDAAESSREARLAGLAEVRGSVKQLIADEPPDDPVLVALADAARRYPIPLEAFEELVAGCEADVQGQRYKTFADLVGYCRQVAGSVGRLSLGVFGPPEGTVGAPLPIDEMIKLVDAGGDAGELTTAELADVLGVALQLTNILRDVLEDRRNGRIYLPSAEMLRFSCGLRLSDTDSTVDGVGFNDNRAALAGLIRFQAQRAERWYRLGLRLLPRIDHRSAACTGAMAGIYRRLLRHIWRDPLAVSRQRLSLPATEKALVAARALAGWRR